MAAQHGVAPLTRIPCNQRSASSMRMPEERVYCGCVTCVATVVNGQPSQRQALLEGTLIPLSSARRHLRLRSQHYPDQRWWRTYGVHPPHAQPEAQASSDAATTGSTLEGNLDPQAGSQPTHSAASEVQQAEQAQSGSGVDWDGGLDSADADSQGRSSLAGLPEHMGPDLLEGPPSDLAERQPGSDGGVWSKRSRERSHPNPVNRGVQLAVTADLVECVVMKSRGGWAEAHVKDLLRSKAAGYRRVGRPDIAAALPADYKAAITMLQKAGEGCVWAGPQWGLRTPAQPNRFHLGTGCHMAGIADCVTQRAGKRDAYDSVIGIIVDELLDLYHNGISVYDAHAKEHVHIMAKLVAVLSDLQGHRANLKTGCGCAKCTIKGGPKLGDDGKGKTPFHNHAPCLAPGDPLRAVLSQLHNQPPTRGAAKVPRTGRETSTWRYRNQMEMARCTKGSSLGLHPSRHDPDGFKPFPVVTVGTSRKRPRQQLPEPPPNEEEEDATAKWEEDERRALHPLARLPYFNFQDMVVLDAMHTIGGVLQSLFKLIIGLKEAPRITQYERRINRRTFQRRHCAGKADRARLDTYITKLSKGIGSRRGGKRMARLLDANKKAKMHHYFEFAGPQGTMAMAQLHSMPERQRLAYMHLFAACGDLWAKQVPVADLPKLQLRVLHAICLAEAHLPASEADVKLHDLLHLALDELPTWGPLFTLSMFGPESIWGKVARLARNRSAAAASMIKAVSDIAAGEAMMVRLDGQPGLALDLDPELGYPRWLSAPHQAVPEEAVLDSAAAATDEGSCVVGGKGRNAVLDGQPMTMLLDTYRRLLGDGHRFYQLWTTFLGVLSGRPAEGRPGAGLDCRGNVAFLTDSDARRYIRQRFPQWIRAQRHATAADHAIADAFDCFASAQQYNEVCIGSLRLKVGGWFLARPSRLTAEERASLWFGQVVAVLQHMGPDGVIRRILKVDWRRTFNKASGLMFHPQLRTPLVEKALDAGNAGHFWPASHVVPWLCWAEDVPGQPSKLAIIARHWGILRPLGLPSVSGTSYPLPAVLLTQDPTMQLPAEAQGAAGAAAAAGGAGEEGGEAEGSGANGDDVDEAGGDADSAQEEEEEGD